MNASKSALLRALCGLGYATLLLTSFEACSGDDASTPLPPDGPATLEITGIALSQGFVDNGGSSLLACDYSIGVNVQTTNWKLFGPGRCGGALQCGQLRVSLLGGPDRMVELATVVAAGNGVALDVRSLISATPPLQDGMYAIQVELVDDAGKPYLAVDGGNGSAQKEFSLVVPTNCASTPESGGTNSGGAGAGGNSSGGSAAGSSGTGGNGAGGNGAGGNGAGGDGAGAAGTAGANPANDAGSAEI